MSAAVPSARIHAIAILAGGVSRRMGRDKALLPVDGTTLLERTARIGHELDLPVLVVGRQRPDGWRLDGVGFVPDQRPGEGPLMGLASALAVHPSLLVLPCDLPWLDVGACRWLLAAAAAHADADGVLAGLPAGAEPLFACYRAACLPAALALLAAGRRSVLGLAGTCRIVVVPTPAGLAPQLYDADTPDDLGSVSVPRESLVKPR